jgi:hypothetical protein
LSYRRERSEKRQGTMREYFAREINLVNAMATDDDQRFGMVAWPEDSR